MNILVMGAHPDDEILGVGGTLLKHFAAGDSVSVCIVTKSYQPRWPVEYQKNKISEQRKVDKLLGIRKRYNLDFECVKLNTVPFGILNSRISEVVNEVNPDRIYTHFEFDLNDDHGIVFRAVMVSARPPKKATVYCYETVSETEWNNKPFIPNMWVDITGYIDKKIEAFRIYESEVKKYPHPRSPEGIRIISQKRGMEAGMLYAEAFSIIKEYR